MITASVKGVGQTERQIKRMVDRIYREVRLATCERYARELPARFKDAILSGKLQPRALMESTIRRKRHAPYPGLPLYNTGDYASGWEARVTRTRLPSESQPAFVTVEFRTRRRRHVSGLSMQALAVILEYGTRDIKPLPHIYVFAEEVRRQMLADIEAGVSNALGS